MVEVPDDVGVTEGPHNESEATEKDKKTVLPWPPEYKLVVAEAVCLLEIYPDPRLVEIDPSADVIKRSTAICIKLPIAPEGLAPETLYILTTYNLLPSTYVAKRAHVIFDHLLIPKNKRSTYTQDHEDRLEYGFKIELNPDVIISDAKLDVCLIPLDPSLRRKGVLLEPIFSTSATEPVAFCHAPGLGPAKMQDLDPHVNEGAPCFTVTYGGQVQFNGLWRQFGFLHVERILCFIANTYPNVLQAVHEKLICAARFSNLRNMRWALKHGARVNYQDETFNRRTALHLTAHPMIEPTGPSAIECTELLCRCKAKIGTKDGNGMSCLMQHAYCGSAETLAVILKTCEPDDSIVKEKTQLGQTLENLMGEDEEKLLVFRMWKEKKKRGF